MLSQELDIYHNQVQATCNRLENLAQLYGSDAMPDDFIHNNTAYRVRSIRNKAKALESELRWQLQFLYKKAEEQERGVEYAAV